MLCSGGVCDQILSHAHYEVICSITITAESYRQTIKHHGNKLSLFLNKMVHSELNCLNQVKKHWKQVKTARFCLISTRKGWKLVLTHRCQYCMVGVLFSYRGAPEKACKYDELGVRFCYLSKQLSLHLSPYPLHQHSAVSINAYILHREVQYIVPILWCS